MEQQWIVDVVLPRVLSDAFPKGSQLVSHEIGAKKGGNAGDGGFASNTFQVEITVKTENGKESSECIIIKVLFYYYVTCTADCEPVFSTKKQRQFW